MTFGKLAEYFEKLEQTASRLSLIDILSELFKEVKASEVAQVSYLLQGRVAPFYEPIEMGMSEKLVAQAIAKAYGTSKEEVSKEFSRIGDLGKVAQRHSGKRSASRIDSGQARMTVTEVFETLLEIDRKSV